MPDESILQNLSATVSPIAASYGVDQLYFLAPGPEGKNGLTVTMIF